MNPSSSPPVLYLEDDDDNNNEQNPYFQRSMSLPKVSSSSDMNLPRKKRKLPNTTVHDTSPIVNCPKRSRNDSYQRRPAQDLIDSDQDCELILLDPNEYVIEEPNSQSYSSFDWTIQSHPPLSSLMPTKISSNPVQTIPRASTSHVNNGTKRPMDKPDAISATYSNDKFVPQPRKPTSIPLPRPSLALLSLQSSKPTSCFTRPTSQRGRPLKNSRVPNIQPTSPSALLRSRPEQSISAQKVQTPPPRPKQPIFAQKVQTPRPPPALPSATTAPTSSVTHLSSEHRRQLLNGTGLFSAFHDSKYYRCNICKFKSVTSSTLLQHLFTHMFFCEQCSFYTYSYFNLSQHMFDKHQLNLIEEIQEPLDPKSFDLVYVTRYSDGKFALCMDSSSSTNKTTNNDQQLIISSAIPTDQQQNKSPKKKILSPKEDTNVPLLAEKRETNHRSLVHSKSKEKGNQTYVLMKHRRCYLTKKRRCLHSLTLEYNICREHTIRHMSQTQEIDKRRRIVSPFRNRRLIDEVASCLKTIVNEIVDDEENSEQSALIQTLPNDVLNSMFSTNNLQSLTSLLKLKNKHDQYVEQNALLQNESSLRCSHEHIFVLSSPETNHTEQTIVSSLHSSMTNGDSIFTQTKVQKLSTNYDNTHQYFKGNSNIQSPANPLNSKVPKKVSPSQPPLPKQIPLRPVVSKPSRTSVDRNNNSVLSSKPKSPASVPNVIVLD